MNHQMTTHKIELYGLDLLVEVESQPANPLLALACHFGTVREIGPAHAGQDDPVKIGDRVIVLAASAKYLALGGKKCVLVGGDALLWRFAEKENPRTINKN